MPVDLIDALIRQGASDLTVVSNNAGNGDTGLAALLAAGRVRKMICSFPRQSDSWVFDGLYRAGKVDLEVVPQGNLAERMRAAGAGIGAFFSPTGVGTPLAEGKETRTIDGRDYVLELPIRGDVALVHAHVADAMGNLVYRKTARNFGPVMAAAAATDDRRGVARSCPSETWTPRTSSRRRSTSTGSSTSRGPRPRGIRPRAGPDGGVMTVEHTERGPLDRKELAALVARDIPPGSFVNLGIGQPTMVADYLDPAAGVVLHTENGMLGMGPGRGG